jgi:MFS family permease
MLALGFSQLSSALITTLPLFAGALIQLVSPHAVRALGSYSRWVTLSACIQASSFFIFVAAAIYGNFPEWTIYAAASLYWGASLATGPAWNTWISALVPQRIRTHYFSGRSRLTYLSALAGLVLGGFLLEIGQKKGLALEAFAIVFIASSCLRFASAFFLSRQSEPPDLAKKIRVLSLRQSFAKISEAKYGKVLTYLFFLQIAVHTSSGFITPFMLRELNLSYWTFMLLTGVMILSKSIAMPCTIRLIRRLGLKRALIFASIGIAPLPMAWLASPALEYLIVLQIISGFIWATHELTAFLILFGEIPEEDRTSVLTEFNLLHTSGVVMGAILGGVLFNNLGQNLYGYTVIFMLSSALRLICLLLIPDMGHPIRKVGLRIYERTLGVRPGGGGISRPLVTDEFTPEKTQRSRVSFSGIFNLNRYFPITSRARSRRPEEPQSKHPTQ